MILGQITFNPRIEHAISVIRDEAVNSKAWEEMFHRKDYECDELKKKIKELEEKLCLKACRKSTKK